jgi:hypothetical protein
MSPRNISLVAGLAALVWVGAGDFTVSGAQEPSAIQPDRPVQWHLCLQGTKA